MPLQVCCKNCAQYRKEWCEKAMASPDPDMLRNCQYYRALLTFENFSELLFTVNQAAKDQLMIYAFDNEDCLDEFVRHGNTEGLVFIHSSDLKPHVTLTQKWCEANVTMVYAVSTDKFAVLLEVN